MKRGFQDFFSLTRYNPEYPPKPPVPCAVKAHAIPSESYTRYPCL